MPTQRAHGGAPVTLIPLNLPGFQGLNLRSDTALLGPEWATRLNNAVIDENNRLAARKGFSPNTVTPLPAPILSAATFISPLSNQQEFIVSIDDSANTLYRSTDQGVTWTDITGTASIADPNVQFLELNDKLYAIQGGGANILMYDGTAFSDVADANQPQGSVGAAAFGRLWIVNEEGTIVYYSSLLDGTDWTPVAQPGAADPGQVSVANVWGGEDQVTALVPFNGRMVVFGVHHILVWADPTGSELGLDPTNLSVVDTLRGIGCIRRELVQNVQGDLWFVSLQGLHSFGRLIQEKSNPLENIAPQVQDYVTDLLANPAVDLTRARSFYSPLDRFFLLCLPEPGRALSSGNGYEEWGTTVVFDTRGQLASGHVRCTGIWNHLVPQAGVLNRRTGALHLAINAEAGVLGSYDGYRDADNTYALDYESGWIDVTQQGYTIIPKRVDGLFYIEADADVNFKWYFDFSDNTRNNALTFPASGPLAEYNLSEFGLGEFGGGLALRAGKVAGSGTGEFIKLGANTVIDGAAVSIQKLDLFVKVGRLK